MANNITKHHTVLLLLAFLFLCLWPATNIYAATSFSVSPLLIDHITEGRDIFTRTITLTNHNSRPARVYASVHEINVTDQTELLEFVPASMSNRSISITSWIEITRGRLELPASGQLEVPLTVRVHPETPAGTYHAFIGFASGANRDEVEAKILSGQGTGVILKVTIDEKQREQLHLVNFITDRFTFSKDKSSLTYTLENSGDTPLVPTGEIIIYNTKGEELTAVAVNLEGNTILPGERAKFTEPLPFIGKLGKNKAYLNVEYGVKNQAAVFDTAFYYSVPWYYLALILLFLLLVLSTTIFIFKRSYGGSGDAYEDGIYELPMFVKGSHDHSAYDHDLNLKNDSRPN